MSRRRDPVDVLKSLRDAGFVTDDAVKKLDAPRVAIRNGVSGLERPEEATNDALDELHKELETLRQAYRESHFTEIELSEVVRDAVYQWLDIEIDAKAKLKGKLIYSD
jgi:hypothetical protein